MKLNSSSILTMEEQPINGDPRISLLHAYADEWNLQIDDIDEDDYDMSRKLPPLSSYDSFSFKAERSNSAPKLVSAKHFLHILISKNF